MKRQAYQKPAMRVVNIQPSSIICASGDWGVVPPGEPNTPPGSRIFDDW